MDISGHQSIEDDGMEDDDASTRPIPVSRTTCDNNDGEEDMQTSRTTVSRTCDNNSDKGHGSTTGTTVSRRACDDNDGKADNKPSRLLGKPQIKEEDKPKQGTPHPDL